MIPTLDERVMQLYKNTQLSEEELKSDVVSLTQLSNKSIKYVEWLKARIIGMPIQMAKRFQDFGIEQMYEYILLNTMKDVTYDIYAKNEPVLRKFAHDEYHIPLMFQ